MLTKSDFLKIKKIVVDSEKRVKKELREELRGDIIEFKTEILGEIRSLREEISFSGLLRGQGRRLLALI